MRKSLIVFGRGNTETAMVRANDKGTFITISLAAIANPFNRGDISSKQPVSVVITEVNADDPRHIAIIKKLARENQLQIGEVGNLINAPFFIFVADGHNRAIGSRFKIQEIQSNCLDSV